MLSSPSLVLRFTGFERVRIPKPLLNKINWQSVMFFGYGDDWTLDQQRLLQKFDRQIFIKLSYTFQQ
jgi:hypothetical protein